MGPQPSDILYSKLVEYKKIPRLPIVGANLDMYILMRPNLRQCRPVQ